MTRPFGPVKVSSSLALPVISQPLDCAPGDGGAGTRARDCRGRCGPPGFQGTTWWVLVKVTLVQPGKRQWRSRRMTSRRWAVGRCPPGPALVHGVADVVVDPDGDGGVTGDPAHGLGADAGRRARARRPGRSSRRPRRRGRRGGRGRRRSTGWPSWLRRRAPSPDHLEEGVAEALVPGRLAVGGDVAGPGLEAGPGLGEGLGRAAGRSRCGTAR